MPRHALQLVCQGVAVAGRGQRTKVSTARAGVWLPRHFTGRSLIADSILGGEQGVRKQRAAAQNRGRAGGSSLRLVYVRWPGSVGATIPPSDSALPPKAGV